MELSELIQKLQEFEKKFIDKSNVFISVKTEEGYFGGNIVEVFLNASGTVTIEAVDVTD
jgi:DNA-binding protein YbaB